MPAIANQLESEMKKKIHLVPLKHATDASAERRTKETRGCAGLWSGIVQEQKGDEASTSLAPGLLH